MSNSPKTDIEALSTSDLMQGLEATAPAVLNSVELWIKETQIRPGSTRVTASDLYAKYRTWLEKCQIDTKCYGCREWGKVMSSRFRRSKINTGSCYYISRESDVDIVAQINGGGKGRRGGRVPGG